MSGKFQKRPFMNLPVPFERDHRPVLRDSWRDFSAHFERTSIHWKRKVTHLRATYALPENEAHSGAPLQKRLPSVPVNPTSAAVFPTTLWHRRQKQSPFRLQQRHSIPCGRSESLTRSGGQYPVSRQLPPLSRPAAADNVPESIRPRYGCLG